MTKERPPKFKLTSPELREADVVDMIMEWFQRFPPMVRHGIAVIHYNGLVPVWGTPRRKPAAGKWHKKGVADLSVSYRGRAGWIEVKNPHRFKYEDGQEEFAAEARAKGCFMIKVQSLVELIEPFKRWIARVDAEEAAIEELRRPKPAREPETSL